jgi:hypothetical protein
MKKSTATRRLVKSPPELWAELSTDDSLGRHLAEFGDIRITRVKPETTVAWEGDRASGTVELTPTGWGTKVSLTATPAAREPPAPTTQEPAEPEPTAAEPEPTASVAEPEPATPVRIQPHRPPASSAPQPVPEEERRGFFSRLFRKRAPAPAAGIPGPPVPAPDPSPPTPAPQPAPIPPPAPDPVPPTPAPQPPPPPQIRALDSERTVAILTEVLDDLGAAHHRPFSRD